MTQKSEKIAEEEAKCQHIADLAQHELDEAIPALEEAMWVCLKTFNSYQTSTKLMGIFCSNFIDCSTEK